MSIGTPHLLSVALRGVLTVGTALFLGFLLLLNGARADSARQYPELAHLAWPVYIGVLIGFVPVFLGLLQAWHWVALAGRGQGRSADALACLHRITRCALLTWGWFSAGLPAWYVASGGMDPPFITFWILMSVPTLFTALLSALLREELRAA